ncbi:MAG: helix-turn-helix domain-containing protein, partial [Candidatus Aenigmarchaeota archaeon]|nr:helix-turn-helix domain-containing protein [Candidatus Aenigmarchaeota archaeon]
MDVEEVEPGERIGKSEAMKLLDVSEKKVYSLITQNVLTPSKEKSRGRQGFRYVFDREQVLEAKNSIILSDLYTSRASSGSDNGNDRAQPPDESYPEDDEKETKRAKEEYVYGIVKAGKILERSGVMVRYYISTGKLHPEKETPIKRPGSVYKFSVDELEKLKKNNEKRKPERGNEDIGHEYIGVSEASRILEKRPETIRLYMHSGKLSDVKTYITDFGKSAFLVSRVEVEGLKKGSKNESLSGSVAKAKAPSTSPRQYTLPGNHTMTVEIGESVKELISSLFGVKISPQEYERLNSE